MCERIYVACGGCSTPATDLHHVDVYDRREVCRGSVDEDGHPHGDGEYEDGDSELVESYFECPCCDWRGTELDHDCEPDECDCDECIEPDPADEGPDPERIVMLVRTNDSRKFNPHESAPQELRILLTDRTIDKLPMPRWRATELWNDHIEPCGAWPLEVDFEIDVRDELVSALMLTYERTEATVGAE